MKHELVDGTLTRSASGIAAICTCGWRSAGHFTSLAASCAFRDHQEQQAKQFIRQLDSQLGLWFL